MLSPLAHVSGPELGATGLAGVSVLRVGRVELLEHQRNP